MGSYYGSTSEIVEVLEEVSYVQNGKKTNKKVVHNQEEKPQLLKLGYDSTLEDDINKLFESISLKVSSKNQNSPDQTTTGISKKNALKKPMRASGSHSPGIGFSEPVSLKQALRRQCISQASEMAAIKRLTNPIGSPRISEAGMITSMYRSVVVESGESSGSANRFSRDEEELSSPGFSLEKYGKGIKSMLNNIKPVQQFIVKEETTKTHTQITKSKFEKPDPSGEIVSEKENDSVVTRLEQKKASPRSRRKGRLLIAANSSNTTKSGKSLRKVSPTFKSVRRNKSMVKKNLKLASVPTEDVNSKIHSPTENNSNQLLCQRCHCTMTHERTESSTGDIEFNLNGASSYGKGRTIVELEKSRIVEKVDFSQSSNSSLGDYSTSTSNSEESNVSGSICGNRPHMVKDSKWEAIQQAKKHNGGLGLAHFNLLKKLGSGDIGTVYLAELVGTNCMFAIKVMDNEFLARRKKITRAQTERDILRMLDHPFLPTLYGQFTSDNLSCLIMEYCPGGDLHVLRQRQPGRFFPEQAARFYVAEVLLALEYLHMLGVIYRDLKPENIMVREDGHIMLTDFDLSLRCEVNPTLLKSSSSLINEPPKISGPCSGSNCIDPFCAEPTCQVSCFSPHLLPPSSKQRKAKKPDLPTRFKSLPQLVAEPTDARSNSFVGTHEYLAPEIIKGEGHGSAVDWWTYGVFLYELLYGRTPFKGSGNEETLANVILQGLRFPDSPLVSFQARDLIRGLLVKEPENRLGSQRGAAEIKQHPFFDGLNWALIRCAIPPQVPEFFEVGQEEMEIKYFDCGTEGDQLEFELF